MADDDDPIGSVAETDVGPQLPDDPFWRAAYRLRRSAQPRMSSIADPTGYSDVADTFQSIPRGLLTGLMNAGAPGAQAEALAMGDPQLASEIPNSEDTVRAIEQHVIGKLHEPQTLPGHYMSSIAEMAGNPANWVGPGSIPFKAAWNAASGVGGETGAQAFKDTSYENAARFVGSWTPAAIERAWALAPRGAGALPAPRMPVEELTRRVQARLAENPEYARLASEPAFDEVTQTRLAQAQRRSDQAQREAEFQLGPNPSREDFAKFALRPIEGAQPRMGDVADLGAYRAAEGGSTYGRPAIGTAGEAGLDVGPGLGGAPGGSESLRQAYLQAQRRAGGRASLSELPTAPQLIEGEPFVPGPVGRVHDVADAYMADKDFGVSHPTKFHALDKNMSAHIAQAFDQLPMYDPAALPSYEAMIKETLAQYQAIKNSGLKITPVDATTYPYGANPRAVAKDVADNNHMAFFKTKPEVGSFGTGGNVNAAHPMLRPSGEYIGDYPMLNNDLFRVVHDYFGHIKNGYGFRAAGEDNAWRSHAAMYSPEARPAMTAETRGQNSWVNYGPHGDFNRTASGADTIYSPQKVALMPDWTMGDLADPQAIFRDAIVRGRSGRPIQTARLPIGTEQAILDAGLERTTGPNFKELEQNLALNDPDYVYHATNMERARDIAESGSLNTHRPHEFTDQSAWPDGSTQKRNYFSNGNPWMFAPEEGTPTILRIDKTQHPFQTEKYTNDVYSTKPVPSSAIEYLDQSGTWRSLQKPEQPPFTQAAARKGQPLGSLADIAPTAPRTASYRGYPSDVSKLEPADIEKWVNNPLRVFKPGIYKNPRLVAAEAAKQAAPEHPALRYLFNLGREDLYDISQQGRRVGNIDPTASGALWTPSKMTPSYASEAVMNPRNAQRLIDSMAEAQRYPSQLIHGGDAWYVFDPAYWRLVELVGKDKAKLLYTRYNNVSTPFSSNADVLNEINRGSAANMMVEKGRFGDFAKYAGVPVKERAGMADFPPELLDVKSHLRHSSHLPPVERYLRTGEHGYNKDTVKNTLYNLASGVPETGFQTSMPIPDSHFARAGGFADVREGREFNKYLTGSEYRTFAPWYNKNVAEPLGIQPVSAQGRQWGVFAPQTGVKSPVGASKLELWSQRVWERAKKLGIDPRALRDEVLLGENHANWLLPTAGGALTMGALADQGNYQQ